MAKLKSNIRSVMKRKPKVGDWVRITNPWGDKWKEYGISQKDRKAVKGMVGKITRIQEGMKTGAGLYLDYVINIISSKDEIRKTMPGFSGQVWDIREFEVIHDKLEIFCEVL